MSQSSPDYHRQYRKSHPMPPAHRERLLDSFDNFCERQEIRLLNELHPGWDDPDGDTEHLGLPQTTPLPKESFDIERRS